MPVRDSGAIKASLSPKFMAMDILSLRGWMDKTIRLLGDRAFERIRREETGKVLVYLDLYAERTFQMKLLERFPDIRVIGEESLREGMSLRGEKQLCILLDMIDGTDLLERGFHNWCSAIVVFDPHSPGRIEASYVALPDRTLYYANSKGAFSIELSDAAGKTKKPARPLPLKIPSVKQNLAEASVCMYAQKGSRLLSLIEMHREFPSFVSALHNISSSNFRYYNLAGNPMMARMTDGAVDIVMDLVGQHPHDVVPGAFIALKAGAVMGTPDGRHRYTVDDLSNFLYEPADTSMKYILAANEQLYERMVEALTGQGAYESSLSSVDQNIRRTAIEAAPPP